MNVAAEPKPAFTATWVDNPDSAGGNIILTAAPNSRTKGWTLITVDIPVSHGITLPEDGIENGRAHGISPLTVTATTKSSGGITGKRVDEVDGVIRYRCFLTPLQISNTSLYCAGNNNVRVCAAKAEHANAYAQNVVRPMLLSVSDSSCRAQAAEACGPLAKFSDSAISKSRCCSQMGVGDLSMCSMDSDCDGINTIAPQTAVSGVPAIPHQCCASCEATVNGTCSVTPPSPFIYSADRCKKKSCAKSTPCYGYALSRISVLLDAATGAVVKLASGSGFTVAPGVWPPEMSGKTASVTVLTSPLPPTAIPSSGTLISEVLTFEPSGIKFPAPGVRLFFSVPMSSIPTDPKLEIKVHRLTDGVFIPLEGDTIYDVITGLVSAVTFGFSSYAVIQVPKPELVVPDQTNTSVPVSPPPPKTDLPSIAEITSGVNPIAVGVGAAVGGILLLGVVAFFMWRYKKTGGLGLGSGEGKLGAGGRHFHLGSERKSKPVFAKNMRDSELVVAVPTKQAPGKDAGGKATLLLTEGDSGSGMMTCMACTRACICPVPCGLSMLVYFHFFLSANARAQACNLRTQNNTRILTLSLSLNLRHAFWRHGHGRARTHRRGRRCCPCGFPGRRRSSQRQAERRACTNRVSQLSTCAPFEQVVHGRSHCRPRHARKSG